jgi:hypothetical protein
LSWINVRGVLLVRHFVGYSDNQDQFDCMHLLPLTTWGQNCHAIQKNDLAIIFDYFMIICNIMRSAVGTAIIHSPPKVKSAVFGGVRAGAVAL